MKRQISWQRTGSEHPFTGPEPAGGISVGVAKKRSGTGRTKITQTMEIYNWTKRDKRTYTRALCQKNEGSVEIKQRQTKMGGRTIYRSLPPKRTPFQTWIDR
jgi:hypothetical protein